MKHNTGNQSNDPKLTRTLIMYIFMFLVTAFALLSTTNVTRLFTFRSKAQLNPIRLYLTPATAVMPPGKTIKLMIDSGNEKVVFTRIELTFDQTRVQLAGDIGTTGKLRTILRKTTKDQANASGRIVLILGLAVADKGNPPTGTYELAAFTFIPRTSEHVSVPLSIDPSALQLVNWDGSELVTQNQNMKFTLNPQAVPTRLPTQARPRWNPTPTPTPTAIVDPTGIQFPTYAPPINSPTPVLLPEPTPEPIRIEGDITGDQCVNFADIRACLHVLWPFGPHTCDSNTDGKSNLLDLFYIITRLGNGCGT